MSKKTRKKVKDSLNVFKELEDRIEELVIDIFQLEIKEENKKELMEKCDDICKLMSQNGLLAEIKE